MSAEIVSIFDIRAQREMLAAAAAEGRKPFIHEDGIPGLNPRELLFYRNLTFFGRILSDPEYGAISYKMYLLEATHEPVAMISCDLYTAYFYILDGLLLDFGRDPIITRYAPKNDEAPSYPILPVPKLEPYHD